MIAEQFNRAKKITKRIEMLEFQLLTAHQVSVDCFDSIIFCYSKDTNVRRSLQFDDPDMAKEMLFKFIVKAQSELDKLEQEFSEL